MSDRANSLLGNRALIVFMGSLLLFTGHAFSCGHGKGAKSEKSDERGHGRVGVGVNVDLGGVGRRKAEADPFAVPVESSTTSRSEGKKAKKPVKESGSGNTFAHIQLTGEKAKDENNPPGPINISDNVPSSSPAGPSTVEAPPPDKEKKQTTTQTVAINPIDKLPAGYKIVKKETSWGTPSFIAVLDSARPSLPLAWDAKHGVWTPPGFVPDAGDPDRSFNQTTGQNAFWDDKAKSWIDTKTGKALTYEQ